MILLKKVYWATSKLLKAFQLVSGLELSNVVSGFTLARVARTGSKFVRASSETNTARQQAACLVFAPTGSAHCRSVLNVASIGRRTDPERSANKATYSDGLNPTDPTGTPLFPGAGQFIGLRLEIWLN